VSETDFSHRYRMLGGEVNKLTLAQLNQIISAAVTQDQRILIANHNLHSIYLVRRDSVMQQFYRLADYIHVDGMPLIIWGKILGFDLNASHRTTYVDWIHPLMALANAQGWRVFYLGGKLDVVERGIRILQSSYPDITFAYHPGYFDVQDAAVTQAIIQQIQSHQPQLLFVGMGMPRQEHWIVTHYVDLSANVVLSSGACIDYVAQAVVTPPRWLALLSLEWFYRLLAEPRRLWKRYLYEPLTLIDLLLSDLWQRIRRKA
jgi:N-acetylglucosaminyldiphosphoundecaprenol N-acetyl-beta-D-mannosaminyltransferase